MDKFFIPAFAAVFGLAASLPAAADSAPAEEAAKTDPAPAADPKPADAKTGRPGPVDAEVVFVLDTTGSMSGLIEGAKQKIWSLAGGIIERTGGEVRIGLVPYRDRGDDYVTRLFPLTNNLDQVYADLQGFCAAGGGDGRGIGRGRRGNRGDRGKDE